MTEDTRKDKRAKIVSLNVRYKSATVDEFIENHSHDVSKGGIFIKTPTPFPPGTLIKFEIRIAGDKPVITGVGRVVWKRDPNQAASDRPSGMGVKFIKIDEPSRQIIDRVVAEKEGAGSSYASEVEDGGAEPALVKAPLEKKATLMGVGIPSVAPPEVINSNAPPTVSMFPSTNSEEDMPPAKERTVMKQAAELLEEALKEAGGSMDEIGTNPLFAEGNKLEPRIGSAGDMEKKPATLVGLPPSGSSKAARPSPGAPTPAAPEATAKVSSNPPDKKVTSDPPRTTRETPIAKVAPPESSRNKRTDPPAGRRPASAAAIVDEEPPKKKGSSAGIWIVALLVVGGAAVAVYKGNLFGTDAPPAPPAPATVAPPNPTPTPEATATPPASASAAASPSASASAAPSASASAAASPSASASAAASSKPAASASAAPSASAAATAKPAPPPPAPKPTPPPAPKPTAAAPSDTPPPAPKPKPKPKPTSDDTDNPY